MEFRLMCLPTKRRSLTAIQYERCNMAQLKWIYSSVKIMSIGSENHCHVSRKAALEEAAYPASCHPQSFDQVSHDCFPVWTLDVWDKGCHWLFQSPVILTAYIKISLWWDLILLILCFVLGKKDKNRKKEGEKNQGGREERKEGVREEKKPKRKGQTILQCSWEFQKVREKSP